MTDTITVVGNIASIPERRTAGAFPVTSFRVATTERRLDPQGAWVDVHTNFYSVSAFRTLGDNAFTSLRKGDRVVVGGRLRLKEWTAGDGTTGRSMEIDADMLGHDLRFGTTVFQRRPRTDGSAGEADAAATTADGWSTQGLPADNGADAGPVGNGIGDADADALTREERMPALAGADTPF